jgi:NAD-dependent dihydropyrimidine dehydrogenase PreA subunit
MFMNEVIDGGSWMAYRIIEEECISCGACASECPNEAIKEAKECYVIDAKKCNDCGSCTEVCPQECIVSSEE